MTQREEPIRSKALRDSARGAPCMVRFPCCNHNPETSVWAHWDDEAFGGGRKAHDTSGFPACSDCHYWLDVGWAGKMSREDILVYVIRALQRTFVYLVRTEVVRVKLDTPKRFHARPTKPRKPDDQRKEITQRKTDWPSRKIPTSKLRRQA